MSFCTFNSDGFAFGGWLAGLPVQRFNEAQRMDELLRWSAKNRRGLCLPVARQIARACRMWRAAALADDAVGEMRWRMEAERLAEQLLRMWAVPLVKHGAQMRPPVRNRPPSNPVVKALVKLLKKNPTASLDELWERITEKLPKGCEMDGAEILYRAPDKTLIYVTRNNFRGLVFRAKRRR